MILVEVVPALNRTLGLKLTEYGESVYLLSDEIEALIEFLNSEEVRTYL